MNNRVALLLKFCLYRNLLPDRTAKILDLAAGNFLYFTDSDTLINPYINVKGSVSVWLSQRVLLTVEPI